MTSIRTTLLAVIPSTALVIACVGDTAVVVVPDAGGADATSDVTVQRDATSEARTPIDAGSDVVVDSPPDAPVEAEAGKPQPTCVDQTMVSGAYNHVGCQANASSVSPGGLFAVGNYVNAALYGQPYCPIAYAIGSASVFQEKGQTYFRYMLTRKTSTGDPGTTTYGTLWIQTNGNGDLTVEEMCNIQNKGLVRTGTLSIVGSDYTMTFKNGNTVIGQERWTKQ